MFEPDQNFALGVFDWYTAIAAAILKLRVLMV